MLFTSVSKYLGTIKGAIHIGAHAGGERDWYKEIGFSPVLWFEPNKSVFDRLEKNLEGYDNQLAFNLGVHDTLKEAVLHVSSNDGESSSILQLGTHKIYYPKVHYVRDEVIQLIRMDDFFKQLENIDDYNFLNIDVQGVELNVIKSFGKLIAKIDYIYVEVNTEELYVGCSQLVDIDKYLGQFGFIRLAQVLSKKSKWGDAFYKRY